MKKVFWIAVMMLGMVFVSCHKDDARDAFTGSYVGRLGLKGTRVVDGGDPQSISENRVGYFSISQDGKKGNRVTIKIIGVDYGTLSGSVDNDVLTIDPLHTTIENTSGNTKNSTVVDLSFQPARIDDKHLILNGSLHALATSVTSSGAPSRSPLGASSVSSSSTTTEDIQATLLIEADKQ